MITKQELKPLGTTAGILLIAAIAGTLFTDTSATSLLSIAFASLIYIILPGYCIMLNFKLTDLERIIFAMPTSITIVSITLYSADLIGIPLSTMTTIITIIVLSLAALTLRKFSVHNINK